MKTLKTLFLFGIVALSLNTNGQSLTEALGGVNTQFDIYSDTINLEVKQQCIIKRANTFKQISNHIDWSYALGGGYESLHLEFSTTKNLQVVKVEHAEHSYLLEFVKKNGVILAVAPLNNDQVKLYTNPYVKNPKTFYSIDLIHIPICILEETHEIIFTKITSKGLFGKL